MSPQQTNLSSSVLGGANDAEEGLQIHNTFLIDDIKHPESVPQGLELLRQRWIAKHRGRTKVIIPRDCLVNGRSSFQQGITAATSHGLGWFLQFNLSIEERSFLPKIGFAHFKTPGGEKSLSELEQMVFEVLSPVDFYTCSYVTLVYN